MTQPCHTETSRADTSEFDVVVVGAGIGGLYGLHRFSSVGLSVLGIEAASGVGGVWFHNRYPGARVDVDSVDYCYHFSSEIWRQWRWRDRYAAQPDLLAYLEFVADHLDLRRHIWFDTRVIGATWSPGAERYHVVTDTGRQVTCRFLVMATGQLSRAKRPDFPGLERFVGECVQSSHWPAHAVPLDGRRIGIIGTGSSGVQAIPVLAERAAELVVFQRTANYVVPARNHPIDDTSHRRIGCRLMQEREGLLASAGGTRMPMGRHPASEYSPEQQLAALERQWERGGQGMTFVFTDQGTDKATNDVVAEFVRGKVRSLVEDENVANALVPRSYPIGTRRLALDTGYYETFNRDNVTLVDLRDDPIEAFTATGIRTATTSHDLDLIVFALGFHAFTGALDAAGIRNERGEAPSDGWAQGPRTILGLMTPGFPNLFTPTGPGSPSVIANLFIQNEFAMDWIADCIGFLDEGGFSTIEPTEAGADAWTSHAAEVSQRLLRRQVDNYMVQVTPSGRRVFLPYAGGFHNYVQAASRIAEGRYVGFNVR